MKITKYQKGKKRPIKGSKIQLIDEVSAAAADLLCMLTVEVRRSQADLTYNGFGTNESGLEAESFES